MKNRDKINKKDVGIILIIIDILICIFSSWFVFNFRPVDIELVRFSEIFNAIYFSRSKLFMIGLFLILLDSIEKRNKI